MYTLPAHVGPSPREALAYLEAQGIVGAVEVYTAGGAFVAAGVISPAGVTEAAAPQTPRPPLTPDQRRSPRRKLTDTAESFRRQDALAASLGLPWAAWARGVLARAVGQ